MIRVTAYRAEHKGRWDDFVARSKNGVFLFQRDYMDYHADRFTESSLMFEDEDGQLVAVMPASVEGAVVTSHGGLTFGGVVTDARMKVEPMLDLFGALEDHLRQRGVTKLVYKVVPHIYHRLPAEEDLYALFRHGARLIRRDVSATIDTAERAGFSKGRKWSLKQATKAGLRVEQSSDFETFMVIEERLLEAKYGAKPVHTAAEVALLARRFPDQIKLFVARDGARVLAGVIIYESERVAHAQYIGASEEGKKIGALDLIFDYLINDYYSNKRYFDFGISTEEGGRRLNAGLIENKQSYGARAVAYDFYELELARQN
jgi:hypothetical protein